MSAFRIPNEPLPQAELIAELPDGTKIKRRAPRMRACSEKDAKGKTCVGHLKRWFSPPDSIRAQYGDELYRCEKCKTIYLPNSSEAPRTGTLSW